MRCVEGFLKFFIASFNMDFVAAILRGSGRSVMRKMERSALRILRDRRRKQSKMRCAAAFVRAGPSVSRKTHNRKSMNDSVILAEGWIKGKTVVVDTNKGYPNSSSRY